MRVFLDALYRLSGWLAAGFLAAICALVLAQVLLNLTSDVWFGEARSLLGSFFLHQHPRHLVLRTVELRVPAARAANPGKPLSPS